MPRAPSNGSATALGSEPKPRTAERPKDTPLPSGDDVDGAFSHLQQDGQTLTPDAPPAPPSGTAKRGRKPGAQILSAHDRLQQKIKELEAAKLEAKQLEREARQRVALVVGDALLDLAERDAAFKPLLLAHLRQAKLSARERAEIAHLFIDSDGQ